MNDMNSMRDLTKSMASYTWAMSVYSAQQMMSLMTPQKATDSFDKVTAATVNEMDNALKETFQVGDRIQRGMVDIMMGSLGMFGLDPGRWLNAGASVMQQSMGAMQRATEGAAKAAQRAASATPGFRTPPAPSGTPTGRTSQASTNPPAPGAPTGSSQPLGWSPMPK
jgi:hypothetical protein